MQMTHLQGHYNTVTATGYFRGTAAEAHFVSFCIEQLPCHAYFYKRGFDNHKVFM
jgi:hypothetical protein